MQAGQTLPLSNTELKGFGYVRMVQGNELALNKLVGVLGTI